MLTTATHINYYFVCRKKLWYFSHGLQCEQESDLVYHGKALHEHSYKSKRKEYQFGSIKVDWIDLKNRVVHEVKKSNKMEEAHMWQLKYYLYYLEELGAGSFTGEINYPLMKKSVPVELEVKDRTRLKELSDKIEKLGETQLPAAAGKVTTQCRKCSYFEMCRI